MTKKKLIAITGCIVLLLSMMVGGIVYFRQAKDSAYEQAKNPVNKKPDDSKKDESDEVKSDKAEEQTENQKAPEQKPVEQKEQKPTEQKTPVATKPTSKPSQPVPSKPASKPTSKPAPSKPQHTCTWSPIIEEVYHDAVGHYEQVLVKAAWTEERPIYEYFWAEVCNTCGQIIEGDPGDHIEVHMLKGEGGSWRTEYIQQQTGTERIEHPAEYKQEWVVDSKAWTEQVTVGYKCNGCGKTK